MTPSVSRTAPAKSCFRFSVHAVGILFFYFFFLQTIRASIKKIRVSVTEKPEQDEVLFRFVTVTGCMQKKGTLPGNQGEAK